MKFNKLTTTKQVDEQEADKEGKQSYCICGTIRWRSSSLFAHIPHKVYHRVGELGRIDGVDKN